MSNHPNRARAANARAVERLISAAEKWAAVREKNAASAARNGMIGPTAVAREQDAQQAYEAARDDLRARFASEQ